MEEFFDLNKVIVANVTPETSISERDELWYFLQKGFLLYCKSAGPTFFNDLFADEADVVMSSAPGPHGDVLLMVHRREGGFFEIKQQSRFPLEGFSWKLKP